MSQQFPTSSPQQNAKPFSIAFSSTASASKNPPSSKSTPRQTASRISERQPRQSHAFNSASPSHSLNDNESEGEDERLPVHEEVTGFDYAAGGAISAHRQQEAEKRPLIIKVESKNNWMDRGRRRGRNLLPKEIQIQKTRDVTLGDAVQAEIEGPNKQFGLSYAKTSVERTEPGSLCSGTSISDDIPMADTGSKAIFDKPLTPDELALRALVCDSKGDGAGTRKSDLVITSRRGASGGHDDVYDDGDEMTTFRADVASRPDSASLADYAAVPVEEFGAALLRGMGWKEGEPIGRGKYGNSDTASASRGARVPERRPGYLGIGAKDISGKAGNAETELGAWGKSALRKSKKPGEGLYTPVLMKNKKTGALITEDELKTLTKQGDKREEDWRERRDRNLQKNGRDRKRDYGDVSDDYRRAGESSRTHMGQPSGGGSRDSRRRRYYEDYDDLGDVGETANLRVHDQGRGGGQDRDHNRDHNIERDRDRNRDRDRKHRESGRPRDSDSHSSRPSSASSRRDRDTDRETYRERDRFKDRGDQHCVDRRGIGPEEAL